MGLNYHDYLREAYRLVRHGGWVKIAEPASRWKDGKLQCMSLARPGLRHRRRICGGPRQTAGECSRAVAVKRITAANSSDLLTIPASGSESQSEVLVGNLPVGCEIRHSKWPLARFLVIPRARLALGALDPQHVEPLVQTYPLTVGVSPRTKRRERRSRLPGLETIRYRNQYSQAHSDTLSFARYRPMRGCRP